MKNEILKTPVDLSETLEALPVLSQSNAIGQGIDVFGAVNTDAFITPLLDPNKAGKKEFTFLGKEFLVPEYITPIEDTLGYYEGGTFSSREEFQNNISANAQAAIGYGFFSGEMKLAYSKEFSSSSEYYFTYNNFFSTLAILELGEFEGFQRDAFKQRVAKLPDTASKDNLNEFIAFFQDYGIYFTDKIELGGSLEFYVSVTKTSEMSETEVSAMLKAQYNGAFKSGSISAEIKASESWKKYSQNSQFHIKAIGGDPALAGQLIGIDPLNPSSKTVDAYNKWLSSISSSPAISNMNLTGIWKACGEKSAVVQKAWTLFSETIHPKITLETSSQAIYWPVKQEPVAPIITLNGKSLKPSKAPDSPVGFQAIILSNDGSVPEVLYNKYFGMDKNVYNWPEVYPKMYEAIRNDLTNSEYNKYDNLLILYSYGMGNNLCPTKPFYEYLKLNGAGPKLEYWETHCDPGSQMGNQNYWIVSPINYILVSYLGHGPNTGIELLKNAPEWNRPINSELLVYLFKDSITGKYTLGS